MKAIISKEALEKYGFKKTEKNRLVFWDDYLLEDVNTKYSYFLEATLSIPKKDWGSLEYNFSKLILHRIYDYEAWIEDREYYDTQVVYEGLIENEEDLKFILNKTCITEEEFNIEK